MFHCLQYIAFNRGKYDPFYQAFTNKKIMYENMTHKWYKVDLNKEIWELAKRSWH